MAMPEAIAPRHGAAHFQHVFAGDGYSAGYYSYLWSEVLDADAFEAFVEAGDVFDPALAERLKDVRLFRRQLARRTKPTPPSAAARRGPRRCCASAALRRRSGANLSFGARWDRLSADRESIRSGRSGWRRLGLGSPIVWSKAKRRVEGRQNW